MTNKTLTPEQKAARAKYQREWRQANPEKWKAIAGPSRANWKEANRDEHRECQRAHRFAVRQEILTLLSGALKCQSCGWDRDWRALQIDHIHGGGKHDSRTSGGNKNLWSLRNWIKKYPDAAKEMYQVLCANCNWIKRHENGEQPGGKVPKEIS